MELSQRLYAVARLVTPGNRLADVGTDHGYIPIYLIKEKKIPYGIAMDINKGPLERAKEHIQAEGLQGQIETRLSDGLEKLTPGEAETAVIAGMGGALTIRILEKDRETAASLKELILQPQSELFAVRRFLAQAGFCIEEEDMVLEDGKYYPMMRAVPGNMELAGELEEYYGPVLLKKKHPCLRQYLLWERQVKEDILQQLKEARGEGARSRRQEVCHALERNRQALAFWDMEEN